MSMLFTLSVFLTVLTVTSGLAGNDSPKEEASLTWTGGHTAGKVTVVIDGYTHNSILTSGDSVPLGTQTILVCRVVGLPYGTPLSYTWTCPNGPCEVEGYYGRKVYKEHILAVNTTSTRDGGTYTCQVTPTGGQEATGSFSLKVTGGRVVHSDGRLVPYQFPITDPHQISYLIKEGLHGYRVTCNVSSGTPPPRFYTPNGTFSTKEVTQENYQRSAILDVNVSTFQNRDMYCVNRGTSYFYLYLTSAHNILAPGVNVPRVTSLQVDYETTAHGSATRVIAGYEVTRFGVPMIGQYVNTGRGSRVTISPAVPAAQYRITAWALGDGGRSATPAVVDATTGEADPSPPRHITITRVLQDGVELNWLPPTEPNGEVHYVVEYKREDSGNWTSVSTASDSTHYNLTGLHSGTSYTIRVVAVKGAGQTSNMPTASSTPTPTASSTATPPARSTATPTASSTATPPASSTATPPARSTATPPASSTATPPVSSTDTPPARSTATPPARSTDTPPASSTDTPPASSTDTPPASSTDTPPASSTATHPARSTAIPTDPSPPRHVTITRVFQGGVELNWLPPTEPNGEVHYVVEYKREDSGSWTSVNTASDSTHYNLTGLHSGTNYTIRVVAVKNANRKESMPMKLKLWWETNVATSASTATTIPANTRKNSAVTAGGNVDYVSITAGVMVLVLLSLLGLTAGVVTGVVLRRRALKKEKSSEINAQTQGRSGIIELGRETVEEDSIEVHIYDVVGDDTSIDERYDVVGDDISIDGRAGLYQGLDVGTQDYVSMYTQLRGRTYQELDLKGREEHHYQTVYVHGL